MIWDVSFSALALSHPLSLAMQQGLCLPSRRHSEVSFRPFRGQADYAARLAQGASRLVGEEGLDDLAGVLVTLDDHRADDLAVKIQSQRGQRVARSDGERLNVPVVLPPDLQLQLLGFDADFRRVSGAQPINVVEQGDVGAEVLGDKDVNGVDAHVEESLNRAAIVASLK